MAQSSASASSLKAIDSLAVDVVTDDVSDTYVSKTLFAVSEFANVIAAGAKVISTAVGADHIVVTIEVNGVTEIRTFDPDTLKPLGRLRLKGP